jgi:hypothetical protein
MDAKCANEDGETSRRNSGIRPWTGPIVVLIQGLSRDGSNGKRGKNQARRMNHGTDACCLIVAHVEGPALRCTGCASPARRKVLGGERTIRSMPSRRHMERTAKIGEPRPWPPGEGPRRIVGRAGAGGGRMRWARNHAIGAESVHMGSAGGPIPAAGAPERGLAARLWQA